MLNTNSCVLCGYSITDPVCKGCYIKQTRALLQDLKISYIIKDFISIKLKKVQIKETLNDSECILCEKDTVSICRYCFSLILIRIMREINAPENLINNFKYNPTYEETVLDHDFIPSTTTDLDSDMEQDVE